MRELWNANCAKTLRTQGSQHSFGYLSERVMECKLCENLTYIRSQHSFWYLSVWVMECNMRENLTYIRSQHSVLQRFPFNLDAIRCFSWVFHCLSFVYSKTHCSNHCIYRFLCCWHASGCRTVIIPSQFCSQTHKINAWPCFYKGLDVNHNIWESRSQE